MSESHSSGPASPDGQTDPISPSFSSRDHLSGATTTTAQSDTSAGVVASSSSPSMASPEDFQARRVPSLRTVSDPRTSSSGLMSSSSSVTGALNNARRPPPSAGNLPQDLMQRARDLQLKRAAMSPHHPQAGGANSSLGDVGRGAPPRAVGGALAGGMGPNMRLPPHLNRNMGLGGVVRPGPPGFPQSAPATPNPTGRTPGPSLSERRAMKLGALPGSPGMSPSRGPPRLSDLDGDRSGSGRPSLNGGLHESRMDDFRHYIDAEKGWITFEGAATITRTGVNFAGGHTFRISLDEIQVLDELGKGNYGTVYKVRHAKPPVPRFGPGLSGYKSARVSTASSSSPSSASSQQPSTGGSIAGGPLAGDGRTAGDQTLGRRGGSSTATDGTTGKVMAMKEIRLELDEAKFTTILKELVILHECVSPYIIEFYGAFFQEGAVYMCIEYMDGGSIDKLYAGGIPEPVLRKIAYSTVMGLKSLKEKHNIIHRDVKPTNILVNTRGQVKICDFGVSGNLVASIAKTNIGCQSYMAPERISGGGTTQGGANAEGTYSVQSDIWSLGLTIIECAMGRYPYPPEVSSTIFSQLSAIVNGEPPDMPDNYSAIAHDFVRSCLNKNPLKRHTYLMLMNHPWLKSLAPAEAIDEAEELDEAGSDSADGVSGATKDVAKLALSAGSAESTEATGSATSVAGDSEVAAWVLDVLEKKKSGNLGTPGEASRPALHAAPLAP